MTNILTCNPILTKQLIESDSLPKDFLAQNYKEIYSNYRENFPSNKFFYDRTGTIPHYLNVEKDICPIPEINGFNLSFDQVVEKRAKELLSLGKPINVSWSGGIDSTFVLLTLYHYAADKSQIKIYGTYNSVIESGYYFDHYVKDKIKYNIHTPKSLKNNYICPDNEIFVTGAMGNDLFAPGLVFGNRDSWMIFKIPKETPNIFNMRYQDVLHDNNIKFLEEFIKKSPRKIETLQDLRVWVSFSFNWYNCVTNFHIGIGRDRAEKVYAFFDSDDFQRWAMTHNDPQTKTGDYTDERWQMRDKITEYTGDPTYSINKKKVTSVMTTFGESWLFLLNDYSNIYLEDLQSPTSVSYK